MSASATKGRGTIGLQREDVDAALHASPTISHVDQRGLAIATLAAKASVKEFGDAIAAWNVWRDEITLDVNRKKIVDVALFLRDKQGFGLLSDISPCDRLDAQSGSYPARFNVDYQITKLVEGAPRIRLRVWVNEGDDIPSLVHVWPTADWHEREAFDFFGIEFSGRDGLRRLIMPDDWVGHPMRKDYPIGGEPVRFTNTPREL